MFLAPSLSPVFPAKAGIQTLSLRREVASRINGVAGKTEIEKQGPFGAPRHFPQKGKINYSKSSPSGGSTGEAGVGGCDTPQHRL